MDFDLVFEGGGAEGMGDKRSRDVMGLLIDETLEVPKAPPPPKDASASIIESLSRLVVRMPARGYGTTEFDMTEERRAALVEAGRGAMRKHLEKPVLEAMPSAAEGAAVQREATRLATRFLENAA